ncbi:zincin-like metallopeptidase domain-containing protein [Vibrio genomosp. F10]|uniref:zincin-like metallopeptidase domain-containing protein n=1 Tax=Vibrio genomosp. F10 TaxID=723171 RepID=UPI0002D9CCEF|nr:zincin-like metallopeptidase domain-containing protein [Vibrio genomosp. F10]OEF09550.1 hypothetical protein A1QI_13955 [Vibrio genomosp. F10 str. 9ZB36]
MKEETKKKLSKRYQATANILTRTINDGAKKKIDETEQIEVGLYERMVKGMHVNLDGNPHSHSNQLLLDISKTDNRYNIPMVAPHSAFKTFFTKLIKEDALPDSSKNLSLGEIMKEYKHSGNIIQSPKYHFQKKKGKKGVVKLTQKKYNELTKNLSEDEIKKKGFFITRLPRNTAVGSIEPFFDHLPEKFIEKHFYLREYKRLREIKMDPALHNQELLDLRQELIASNGVKAIELDDRDLSAYAPVKDVMYFAPYERYKNPESYLHITCHECSHSTGHFKKKNRFLVESKVNKKTGESMMVLLPTTALDYDQEEVTGESSAVRILSKIGIFSTFGASVRYSSGYSTDLIKHPERLVKAYEDGNEASDFVLTNLYNYRIENALKELEDYGIKFEQELVADGMTVETTFLSVKDNDTFTIFTDQIDYHKFETDKSELLERIADSAYFSDEPDNRDEAVKKSLMKMIEAKVSLDTLKGEKLTQKPLPELELDEPKQDKKLARKSRSSLTM